MQSVRNYRRLLPFFLLVGLAGPLSSQDKSQASTPKKNLHIYLLIGQSNMAGRASFTDEEAKPIERCFLFNSSSQWVPASNPLNRFSTIRKGLGMQKMNPGYSFALTMLGQAKDTQIGLVVNAKGGTKIEQWEKGTKFYQDAVARAKKASRHGTLKGVLWHQGEGNASMPQTYLDKLKQLIGNLRKDLETPDLPFVAGQIKGPQKINMEIAKLPSLVAHTGYASSEGLTTFDKWHFDSRSMKLLGERYAQEMLRVQAGKPKRKVDALATRQNFDFHGHQAFLMLPTSSNQNDLKQGESVPWVWYAPTLGTNLPGSAEKWMFDKFHQNGIAIAGVNVGESYGSPQGVKVYQDFYQHLTAKKGFSRKPVLLARSRGGLMLYSWANKYPQNVGGIAGIYPVCNIASYPGTGRAAGAFQLTPEELKNRLTEFNPIDNLDKLAKSKVPIFHIHGDNDKVVPLKLNSAIVKTRYLELDGPIEVEVVKGQGHNMWSGWFTSEKLTAFVIKNAKPGLDAAK